MNMRVERLIACDVGLGVGVGVAAGGVGVEEGGVGVAGGGVGVAGGGVGVAGGGVGVAGGGVGVDAGMTVVSSVSELLERLKSWEVVLQVAVFESVPATVGVTTTVTVALFWPGTPVILSRLLPT
jgi:hypothetical protein